MKKSLILICLLFFIGIFIPCVLAEEVPLTEDFCTIQFSNIIGQEEPIITSILQGNTYNVKQGDIVGGITVVDVDEAETKCVIEYQGTTYALNKNEIKTLQESQGMNIKIIDIQSYHGGEGVILSKEDILIRDGNGVMIDNRSYLEIKDNEGKYYYNKNKILGVFPITVGSEYIDENLINYNIKLIVKDIFEKEEPEYGEGTKFKYIKIELQRISKTIYKYIDGTETYLRCIDTDPQNDVFKEGGAMGLHPYLGYTIIGVADACGNKPIAEDGWQEYTQDNKGDYIYQANCLENKKLRISSTKCPEDYKCYKLKSGIGACRKENLYNSILALIYNFAKEKGEFEVPQTLLDQFK